jgi:DNA modification methylase
MQELVKLITPKDGVCLEPFAGSGTTLVACKLEGVDFVGIEREDEYIQITNRRLSAIK